LRTKPPVLGVVSQRKILLIRARPNHVRMYMHLNLTDSMPIGKARKWARCAVLF